MTAPTREAWLLDLIEQLRPWYGTELPATVKVSVGFSSKGVRSRVIGECWTIDENEPQVFIHPALIDPAAVAATVAHELIHACRPDAQHGARFKQLAHAIGLEGRMMSTTAGPMFLDRIAAPLANIGDYPHTQLTAGRGSAGPKQSTRMVKCECPECGYIVRTTAKWLAVAIPVCPVDASTMTAG